MSSDDKGQHYSNSKLLLSSSLIIIITGAVGQVVCPRRKVQTATIITYVLADQGVVGCREMQMLELIKGWSGV